MVRPTALHDRRRAERGFTLIELMITVGIVGVLAVVAYAGYHKFVVTSHQTEANHVLTGIKNRQEEYKAETGSYMNISPSLASNQKVNFSSLYPHCMGTGTSQTPGAFSMTWPTAACGATCCNAGTDWQKLKVQVTAPTYYGFSTVAAKTGGSTPATLIPNLTISGNAPKWPSNATQSPWFVATAVADTDGNGIFTTSWTSSFDNEIYIDMDGE
jgi:type IV pilus assembly protein PilA